MLEEEALPTLNSPATHPPPFQTEGRKREANVETQITLLLGGSLANFWQRARQKDHTQPEWVQEESLVSILRIWNRQGDADAAWKIAECLMERSANFISRNIRVWKGLSHEQVEECIRDVQVQMLEDLFNEGRGCEFWEVRFWLCLKRRILNLVRKYRVLAEMELNPTPIPDDEGHLTNYFERQAAPSTLAPEQSVQVTEALALLSEQERVAFVLYYYEEWPQQEIATHLKVTDRTVRNLLGRASKRLETWRNAQN